MSKIDDLIKAYKTQVSLQWNEMLSGEEKVWFCVYDPSYERNIRARLSEFKIVTEQAKPKTRLSEREAIMTPTNWHYTWWPLGIGTRFRIKKLSARLLSLQEKNPASNRYGGLYTEYDVEGKPLPYSDTNTKTTSLALLAGPQIRQITFYLRIRLSAGESFRCWAWISVLQRFT